MKLRLERFQHDLTCTIGNLFADEQFVCFILEDPVREVDRQPVSFWKVKGDTAIPRGTYVVKLTWSNRFQHFMLQLMDVPGFDGIRIHTGNTNVDTEGCLIPGMEVGTESVLKSKVAYDHLLSIVNPVLQAGESITIEVR